MDKQHRGGDPLFRAILRLENLDECRAFFDDLCTIRELQELTRRFAVAAMLDEKKNYQEISKATGASTATISRVNRCLVYGSGGYRAALDKAEKESRIASNESPADEKPTKKPDSEP